MNFFSKTLVFVFFGTVNVLSGDWIDQEMHERLFSSEPLPIKHCSVSSGLEKSEIPNHEREVADSFEKCLKADQQHQTLSGMTVKLDLYFPKSRW
jgi:hypothetical protein